MKTRREYIVCRAIWTDGRVRVVCSTMNLTNYRWVGRNQNQDSGKLVGFPSAITNGSARGGGTVNVRTLPTGPRSRCWSFKLATFLRRFRPAKRLYKGKW